MSGCVFLSGSLPGPSQPDFLKYGVRRREFDEAVTALTSSCLRRGLRLVFGGHPTVSPLVALVALRGSGGENTAKPPITIYQSKAYRGMLPDETWALFRAGVADIVWTERIADETPPRCDESLRRMRERMLCETRPVAMVCVGGMKGIPLELEAFCRLCPWAREQVHVLAGTGGAARMLAEQRGREFHVPDREALAWPPQDRDGEEAAPIPYPFMMSRMADKFAELPEPR